MFMSWLKSENKSITKPSICEVSVAILRLRGDISISAPHIQDLLNIFPQINASEYQALIITLETTGGTLTCAENIMNWIDHLFKKRGLPVVAVIEERCLSTGLAVIACCDYVIAQPSALFGAFGVIMTWPTTQKLRAKLGLLARVYKSAPLKDFASPYRTPTPEDDAAVLDLINDIHDQFVESLKSKRNLKTTALDMITDGRLITGRQALELGIIDQFGGLATAFEWLKAQGNIVHDIPPYQITFIGNAQPSDAPSATPLDFLKGLFTST